MIVSKQLDYPVTVKASLNDSGDLNVTVLAVGNYGADRTVTGIIDGIDEADLEPVREALKGVMGKYADRAILYAEQLANVAQLQSQVSGEAI